MMSADERRERNRKSQAASRARRRAAPGGGEVQVTVLVPTITKVRLRRLARHWNTQQSNAFAGAVLLAEQQVLAGLDDAGQAAYFKDFPPGA
ncbi:MAG: hypothetical protein FJ261_15655 [Planctomycetes bacterium]|nr:hypothetical protein [Planctomycetota bacterium]